MSSRITCFYRIFYEKKFFSQDDFLLRHYDKGPCKNKLGHSRASVIWHRTQVIGIFAGFGLLLLVASPLLLLAAPCIVCCKCRVCGSSRLEQDDTVANASAGGAASTPVTSASIQTEIPGTGQDDNGT